MDPDPWALPNWLVLLAILLAGLVGVPVLARRGLAGLLRRSDRERPVLAGLAALRSPGREAHVRASVRVCWAPLGLVVIVVDALVNDRPGRLGVVLAEGVVLCAMLVLVAVRVDRWRGSRARAHEERQPV